MADVRGRDLRAVTSVRAGRPDMHQQTIHYFFVRDVS